MRKEYKQLILYLVLTSLFVNLGLLFRSSQVNVMNLSLVLVMTFIGYQDFVYREISNVVIGLISIFFTLLVLISGEDVKSEILVAFVTLCGFATIFYLSNEGIGGSDVKSMYYLSLGVGKNNILALLLISFVVTLLLQVAVKSLEQSGIIKENVGIPFLGVVSLVLGLLYL